MAGLTILPAPPSHRREDLAEWLHSVAKGATQLIQEAASVPEPDAAIVTATAWLATDLGAICEAFADYLTEAKLELELFEDRHGEERRAEMARLLLVGTAALGDSPERKFVADAIRERLRRVDLVTEGTNR